MIVSIEEMTRLYPNVNTDSLQMKLDSIEQLIRKYTNNNFQNRNIRFIASSEDYTLNGSSPFIKEGDTVQITNSAVNDGLYTVTTISDGKTIIDKFIFSVNHNVVTKVEYPASIKQGVINLMAWEMNNRSKIGIKSETLSRHSVTYFDLDKENQIMGYPVSLLGFLKPYMKARF